MWSFGKLSPRRQAVRADAAEIQSTQQPSVWRMGPATIIGGIFFLLASAIFFYPGDRVPYQANQMAPMDLRSPVAFTVDDPQETQRVRDYIKANTGMVLVPDVAALDRIQSQLLNLPQDVRNAPSVDRLPPEVAARWPRLTPAGLSWLHSVSPPVYLSEVRTFMNWLPNLPLVDQATAAKLSTQQSELVHVARAGTLDHDYWNRREIIPPQSRDATRHTQVREQIVKLGAFPLEMADTLAEYLLQAAPPLYHADAKLQEKMAISSAAGMHANSVEILANQTIVKQGQVITPELRERMVLAQRRYEERVAQEHPWTWLLAHLGQMVVVLLVTLVGVLYVTQMNPALNSAGRGWSLIGLLLVTLFIAKGSVSIGLSNATYLVGIAPVLLTTIILVIAFNQRFALVVSLLQALLVTLALGQSAEFFLTAMAGITVFTFGLKEIRTRSKLIEMGVFAGAALFASVWAIGMGRLAESAWSIGSLAYTDVSLHLESLAHASLWAAGAGIGVGFVTLGILPFIERMFKITTAMTLLELCDLNQPLLKRLSQEAPGTFNHALVVGTLAEAAGNAIGGDGLLCRVGAYYHDIGKLSKPQYFGENQSGGPNRHDKLSPAMSLLIIVGHVKDGMELAREYHLPWIVHQFIGQHHGTTLVEYFYHAARQRQAKAEGVELEDASVSDSEFRYPGPKPQTREAAILMICDGAESIVRSLPEPTPGRIEAVIHKLVMKRLMDNQFAECDLTLRDLGLIEQSLAYTLAGVYHGRVAYPKPLAISQPA